MSEERHVEACQKFEESLRLDRATGTMWHLARCYEAIGAVASAWARYREVASLSRSQGEEEKAQAALRRAAALETRLPLLTIQVPRESQVEGLVVRHNETELGSASWGTPLPVDPGPHRIVARAPHRAPWNKLILIRREGGTATVAVPVLEVSDDAASGGEDGSAASARAADADGSAAQGATSPPSPSQRVRGVWYEDAVGWSLVGGGVAAALVGTVLVLRASSIEDDADREIDLERRDERLDTADTFRTAGLVCFVGAGAAAIAGGVVLAITNEEEVPVPTVRPTASVGHSALTVGATGTFW